MCICACWPPVTLLNLTTTVHAVLSLLQRQEPAATAGQQQQQERVSPAAGSVGAKRGNAGALERDERLAKRQVRLTQLETGLV